MPSWSNAMPDSQRPPLTAGLMLLLTSASCLILANLYYAQPILGEIAADIGLERSATGMIVTMSQIGYVLGLLFLAPLGDTVENRRLVGCMTAGAGCGLLAAGVSNGTTLFMAGTLLIGFFAVGTQILIVFGSGLAEDSARGRVLGILGAGLFLGIALARPLSSLFASAAGWRALYLTAGALMLVFSVALHHFLPAVKPAGQRMGYAAMFGTMIGLLFTVPRLIPRILLSAGAFCGFSMFWSAAPLHLLENLHFTHGQVALFAMAGLITPPCVFVAGRLLDKGWSFRLLTLAEGLAVAAWLLTAWMPLAASAVVLAALLIDPAGSVSTMSIQQSVLSTSLPATRGRLNSLNISLNFCGGALGAALGPWLYSLYGWTVMAWTGAAIMLALLLVNLALRPTLPRPKTIL